MIARVSKPEGYWVISPYDSTKSDIFDIVWSFDLKNSVIAIGWRELGDPSGSTERELKEKSAGNLSSFDLKAVWRFYHEISVGDVIIARQGTKRIIGLGKVIRTAFYDEQKGRDRVAHLTEDFNTNFMGVSWKEMRKDFEKRVFTIQTLSEISEERYVELVVREKPTAKENLQEEDDPLVKLSAEESSILERIKIDPMVFETQFIQLGFSAGQARNARRLLARICLKDLSFFGYSTGTIKSAIAYSVYSYLQANGRFRKSTLNQRKIAQNISQSDPVNPESFRGVFHRIVSEFGELFPEQFGGSWNDQQLRKAAHIHHWMSQGVATRNNSAKNVNIYTDKVKQRCSLCGRVREHRIYNEWTQYACPNPQCEDYGLKGRGNIRLDKMRGMRNVALLKCTSCKKEFSETLGSPVYDLRIGYEKLRHIVKMLSEAREMSEIASEVPTTRDTVSRVMKLALQDRQGFAEIMSEKLKLTPLQSERFWKSIELKKNKQRVTATDMEH